MRPVLLAGLAGVSLLALASGLAGPVLAAQSLEETLSQVYAQNPRLQAERARLRATDEQVPQALAGWRPQARVNSGYTVEHLTRDGHDVGTNTRGDRRYNQDSDVFYQLNNRLSLSQPVYSGGETVADTRRAENTVRAGRARLLGAQQDLFSSTVQAFAAVVRARAVLRYTQENLGRLNDYLEGTMERLRLLEVTSTDVNQVETRVSGGEADIARAQSDLDAAVSQYEQLVGEPPGDLIPPKPVGGLPATLDQALAQAAENPRLIQANYESDASRDQVRVAEAALLPDLNLVGELEDETQPSFGIDSQQSASIGAQLTVPLYQRGTEYSRVRQSKQNMMQARYALSDTERVVKREIMRSFSAWQSAERQITALEAQVAAAARSVEGTQEEAIGGNRTTLDVLNVQLDLVTAQTRLARALETEVNASYDLKAAVGGLTPEGLDLPVAVYDPEIHYNDVRYRWFGLSADTPQPLPPPGNP
jgi:outer membrane protein